MSAPIHLAIIGTGLIVNLKHWPALALLPSDFRVVAVVNRTPSKAEMLADTICRVTGTRPNVYDDYRQMLAIENPEAVSLALPPILNPEVAQAALIAHCHVIAEKPIAASLDEGIRMLPWSEQYGRVLMIAENYRYLRSYHRAAQLISEGAIGRPQVARWSSYAHIGPDNPYYQTAWRAQPVHPGGYLSDGGVHHAAVLRLLLGDVETASAQTASVRANLPPADTLSATLRFANGTLATYAVTYAIPGPETPMQVAGPDGALLVWRDKVELWRKDQAVKQFSEPSQGDGLTAMYRDFAHAIRSGETPRSTPAQALADLQLIVACLRSAETGRVTRVSDTR